MFRALTGSIRDLTIDQRDWVEHTVVDVEKLQQSPTTMPDSGSWSITRNALTGLLEMNFDIDFTTISVDDHNLATALTAIAADDISINEVQGNLGLEKAESTQGGNIDLAVIDGNLLDVNASPDGRNLSTSGNASITVQAGTIATAEAPLDVEVGGILTTRSLGSTWLTTEAIVIHTVGGIAPTGSTAPEWNGLDFIAPNLVLNSTDGDTGTSYRPIETMADRISAMGRNVYIHNHTDTELGQIVATETASIVSEGNITAGRGEDDKILADNAELRAEGNIGSTEAPIRIETGEVSAWGRSIYLQSEGDVVVDIIVADKEVFIRTNGSVTDKGTSDAIIAETLTILAGGYIGTWNNPLNIRVWGKVDLSAGLPWIYVINSYGRHESTQPKWKKLEEVLQIELKPAIVDKEPIQNEQGKDDMSQPMQGLLLLLLLAMILWLFWLLWRRRKEEEATDTQ